MPRALPDDDPVQHRTSRTAGHAERAGRERAVGEPLRGEEEALAGANRADALRGGPHRTDDAAARGDHERVPLRLLRDHDAVERGRRRRHREHRGDEAEEKEYPLHVCESFRRERAVGFTSLE